jgi:dipeptidase
MGSDLVVALGPATGNGQTLLGQNCHRPPRECQVLRRVPGRAFAPGETVPLRAVEVPQPRHTFTVLGCQPHGAWGYLFGVNERQVAAGCAAWRSKLADERPGLTGPELVRLALERAGCAHHAGEVLADLLARHGQAEGDGVFLVADPGEALVVEAAGPGWAMQAIHQVRAVSDVAVIRQDWDRLAPGLGARAISSGWWPEDGSKLDFAGALSDNPTGRASALRRWGRATLLLEEQNGRVTPEFVRRLLADHYEGTRHEVDPLAPVEAAGPVALATRRPLGAPDRPSAGPVTPLCQHGGEAGRLGTAASLVACLAADPDHSPVIWCAFGPPCLSASFPVLLDGEMPPAFSCGGSLFRADSLWWRAQQLVGSVGGDPRRAAAVREALARLQARFEQQAEEYVGEAAILRRRGETEELSRLAGSLMQSLVERFEEVAQRLLAPGPRRPALAGALSP